MSTTVHHHRASLKQQNKPFKSKHATKSAIRNAAKGKVARSSPKASANASAAQTRLNRKNTAKQLQAKRRQEVLDGKRAFSGVDGMPRNVAVITLTDDPVASGRQAVSAVARVLENEDLQIPDSGLCRLRVPRFKTSLQFNIVPYRQLYTALDAAKAADYVLFSLSPSIEVDKWGDTLLRTLQAQGLPEVVSVVPQSSQGVNKSLLSFIQYFVPSQSRVYDWSSASDCLNASRKLCEGTPAGVKWREGRCWVLGEEAIFDEDESGGGTLKVTGYVRGSQPMSADRLAHLPGYGDYQVSKIVSAPLPKYSRKATGQTMGVDAIDQELLAEPSADDADSLVSTNEPDDMANEQTWPTEEEMDGGVLPDNDAIPDAQNGTTPKRVVKKKRKVPKGWSEYQAAWIVDSESEDDEGEGGMKSELEEDPVAEEDGANPGILEADDDEEMEEMEVDPSTSGREGRSVAFEELPDEEDEEQLAAWRKARKSRQREEEEDAQFPDEMDTPKEVAARERFARFRGLRSFRTSPWDPYENLPREYARIFQFEDFKRTERRALLGSGEDERTVEPGTRVTIHVKGVPSAVRSRLADDKSPICLFGLHMHEHKVSVLNFNVQRNTEYDGVVRSKDPMILCIGPRRLAVNPVYSQSPGNRKSSNNVHKFERFLRHGVSSASGSGGAATVATVYGPVTFGSGRASCMLLREVEGDVQAPELVATGTFVNSDPTRVIAKRVVLTGHPFKVHKKTATVRWMFFNSDDVAYFKPIQLYTKHGRSGHIKESLGTHGYYKAHFDGPINQMDTVCMSLYKRVFPRWSTLWKEDEGEQGDRMEE